MFDRTALNERDSAATERVVRSITAPPPAQGPSPVRGGTTCVPSSRGPGDSVRDTPRPTSSSDGHKTVLQTSKTKGRPHEPLHVRADALDRRRDSAGRSVMTETI